MDDESDNGEKAEDSADLDLWFSDASDSAIHPRYSVNKGNVLRTIHPLGFRVLIKLRPDSNMSDGGLYLPEGAKSNQQESILGEVVEVASAMDDDSDEETNISGIPLNALVLIPKKAGITVPWDDTLRVVDVKEVLAIVSEADVL